MCSREWAVIGLESPAVSARVTKHDVISLSNRDVILNNSYIYPKIPKMEREKKHLSQINRHIFEYFGKT